MVKVMEVSGYFFLALLVAFFIFAWKKRLPVTASGQGWVQPVVREVRAARDTIVLAETAIHGDRVHKGEAVLEVTDDPVEVGLLRVKEMLKAEASNPDKHRDQTARADLRDLFTQSELPLARRRSLLSPADGWVISPEDKYGQWVPAGDALFSVADFLSLEITAEIAADQKADRVEVGQKARVWFVELSEDPVKGEVVALIPGGPDLEGGQIVTVEAPLTAMPPDAVERARRAFFDGTMERWRASIAVTVAEERLLDEIRRPTSTGS